MHGRTFNALKPDFQTATIWDDSQNRGKWGVIVEKIGATHVLIALPDGSEHAAWYKRVALGDNSTN